MAALEITLGNLIENSRQPVTAGGGGTSVGDPGAGGNDIGRTIPAVADLPPLGAGETAGAAILTFIVLSLLITGIIWMFMDETSKKPLQERFFDFRSALLGGGAIAALATRRKKDDMNEKGKGVDHEASSDGASSPGRGIMSPLPVAGPAFTNEKGVAQRGSVRSSMTGTTVMSGVPMRGIAAVGSDRVVSRTVPWRSPEPKDQAAELLIERREWEGLFPAVRLVFKEDKAVQDVRGGDVPGAEKDASPRLGGESRREGKRNLGPRGRVWVGPFTSTGVRRVSGGIILGAEGSFSPTPPAPQPPPSPSFVLLLLLRVPGWTQAREPYRLSIRT
ncbi:cell wall glycosyl hydrolase [Colletotrichum sojae]|uniref:Cell wall glycosyl hydrolase n=1 Tax=Colletotrichum sojae TaxID=2175907 RepID=A0A8H6IT73_9PEZI|nr:cell wall glycosyl hydrolase [Colletotrichum sojae]